MKPTLEQHPTVVRYRQKMVPTDQSEAVDAEWLRRICLNAGADDVGFVEISRPELEGEKPFIENALPGPDP